MDNIIIKSWLVTLDELHFDESRADVFFAENKHKAWEKAKIDLDIEEEDFDHVDIKRTPHFDKYSDKGFVPPKVLIEKHGWFFECNGCYSQITKYSNKFIYYDPKDHPYCSYDCFVKHEKMIKRLHFESKDFLFMLANEFPELDFHSVYSGYPNLNHMVKIIFKDSEQNGWNDICVCKKSKRLKIGICYGDHNAFRGLFKNNSVLEYLIF